MIGGAYRPSQPDYTNWENELELKKIDLRKTTKEMDESEFLLYIMNLNLVKMKYQEEGGKPFKYAKVWLKASQEVFLERFGYTIF